MAPEQWANRNVDHRSDLYSLVCTYYYLLTGERPFEAPELMALRYQHSQVPLPDPRQHASHLPDGVCRVLVRGSRKDPAERYQNAEELIETLDALLETPTDSILSGTPWDQLLVRTDTTEFPTLVGEPATGLQNLRTGVGSEAQRALERIRSKPPMAMWIAAGLIALFTMLSFGVILYVSTNFGTVKIQFSQQYSGLRITVDGDKIEIAGLDEPFKFKVGEHGLEVKSEKYELFTQAFQVKRGANEPITVSLVPKPAARAISRAKQSDPKPTKLRPSDATLASEGWIDLLKHVDLERDHVAGDWKQDADALTVTAEHSSRIMLPAIVEGSYEFEVEFVKNSSSGNLKMIFPVGCQTCSLVLGDGGNDLGAAFCKIGNWPLGKSNPSFVPCQFENRRSYLVCISVEIDSASAKLEANLDGQPLVRWRARGGTIGITPGRRLPKLKRVGLAADSSSVSFHAARVRSRVSSGSVQSKIRLLQKGERYKEPFVLTRSHGSQKSSNYGPSHKKCPIGIDAKHG